MKRLGNRAVHGDLHGALGASLSLPQPTARMQPAPHQNIAPRRAESVEARCDADRVVQAGGLLSSLLMHPSVVPFQRTFRKSPQPGVYTASRDRPFQAEIGSFTVADNQALCVAEYRFQVFTFSAAIAGDTIPIEPESQGLALAYDLSISNQRPGNIRNELTPTPAPAEPTMFVGNPQPGIVISPPAVQSIGGTNEATQFQSPYGDILALGGSTTPQVAAGISFFSPNAGQFISTIAGGDGLLPQNGKSQQGPDKFPFTFYAKATEAVQVKVVAFKPVSVAVAYFQCTLSGYLMSAGVLEGMLSGVKPCT
jgi:hypothetical protein